MPITGGKSKARAKRKPLSDVSNGGFKASTTNSVFKKSNPQNQQQESETTSGGGGCIDRLLLVHSDLSVLIHQIDELVVQALEKKVRNEKEIESFAHVLYEMQISLKPWVSRFQKLLPTHPTGSENQLETSLARMKITPSINKETKKVVSPYKEKLEFLVSPSPLVSWRADCAADGGRNLFLLTPLPKPTPFSSRLKKSSKSAVKNVAINEKNTVQSVFSSPEKMVQRNNPSIVSTPYMKMSPPKSCILLEPTSECCNKINNDSKYPTMDPVHGGGDGCGGGGSGDSEHLASSVLPSGHLALKYPEIFGIKAAHKIGNARKMAEASPNWGICMSPPKTCVLLEPGDYEVKDVEQNLPTAGGVPNVILCNEDNKNNPNRPILCASGRNVIESTPMCKDLDTTIIKGKRAGENTLKKELWMRFEAATAHEFQLKASRDQQNASSNSGTNKGFMDLLEEASCDNTKLH